MCAFDSLNLMLQLQLYSYNYIFLVFALIYFRSYFLGIKREVKTIKIIEKCQRVQLFCKTSVNV